MKTTIVSLFVSLVLFAGSAQSSVLPEQTAADTNGVVDVGPGGAPAPQGSVDLYITASFKTHHPGQYAGNDLHGTPAYRLQVMVDGKAIEMKGELQAENLSSQETGDPEAGAGIRYRFRKAIRLAAGTHRVAVSLPADDIALEKEVTLTEGTQHRLVFEPVYGRVMEKKRPSANRVRAFQEGISSIVMNLNGKRL